MRSRRKIKSKGARGNALVETIILVGVMVPLFGALPLLGKISDVNNTTIQSSRYVAWERTISDTSKKSTESISTEVNNRFLAKPDLQIKSNQGALTGSDAQNPFWTGFGKQDDDSSPNRLVKSGTGLYVEELYEEPSSLAGQLSSGIVQIGKTMSQFSGGDWDLETESLFTARIGMDIGSNRLLSGKKSCDNQETDDTFVCIRRSNTILVDGWEAENASHAEDRTKALVPAAGFENIGDAAAQIVGMVPFFKDLGTLESDENGGFGYVDSEVVPLDRYIEP